MRYYSFILLWTALLLPAVAQHEVLGLDRLVREADVIVSGSISEIKPPGDRERFGSDVATLKVVRLLHNTSGLGIKEKGSLKLIMPAAGNKVQFKTDVRFAKGASGIWLLRREGDRFRAAHPKSLQPAERLPEINRLRATLP